MHCRRCGKELKNSMRCAFCGYENSEGNVREMTRMEKNFFDGVTIDADTGEETSRGSGFGGNSNRYGGGYGGNYETRRAYVNFGGSSIFTRAVGSFLRAILNGNRLAQIAATLIFLALGALMFFVALPIIFVLLALGIAFFALMKVLR